MRGYRLPVLVLAVTLFVVTTSEFQVAAMLSPMADDLRAPVADLGLLVSVYAAGMAFGGPAVAGMLRRVRPRRALVGVLLGYAVAEAAAGAAAQVVVVGGLRFVTGALSGATFGMALSLGMRLADAAGGPSARGRASAVVLTGLMAGTLLGLPLSHLLATTVGWRASFVVLAGAAAVASLAVVTIVPAADAATGATADTNPAGGTGWGVLRDAALWWRYLGSFLTIGGSFAAFAFIEPILGRGGVAGPSVTLALLGFGVAAFSVNLLAGRVGDASTARRWLLFGLGGQLAALVLLLAAPAAPAPVVTATVLLGATGIALNPLLVTRVVAAAEPDLLVNTVHTSAITLGVAVASAVGSRAVGLADGDLGATVAVGVVLTGLAVLVVAAQRDRVRTAPAADPGR